ncbi:histidine kinase dimerization/phospho-acceptor domain-containing protein [Lysinibacillus antri]|uniref:histidine kinase n=1 Tax=Lysinibacillus antri TaxID=2498145 RepID=A0A3S0P3X8_9BACI|nr:histidine kinase dimerization/phospho-acceptor domain-containing protein [Lysinibacillus antri]RUL52064.1 hypothetical protein EK386_10740 [Lysinibacillus antri]
MKRQGKLLLSLFLITWVVFAVSLLINHGHNYIGKSFFGSDQFRINVENFKDQLGRYVLVPFDAEEAKKNIKVSQEEIEHHRNYYGTLTEQIENIRWQYSDRITEAEAQNDAELKKLLEEERDTKIADITENYNNDEHVEKKIRQQKEKIIDDYVANEKDSRNNFLNELSYFNYSLKNIETGEKFDSGEVNTSDIFKERFGDQKPYFNVDISMYLDPYGDDNGVALLEGVHVDEHAQFEGTISIPKSMLANTSFGADYQSFTITKVIFYIIWATGILALVGLLTIAKPSIEQFKGSNRAKGLYLKWPIDIRIVLTIISAFIAFGLSDIIGNEIRNNYVYYEMNNWISLIVEFLIYIVFMFVATIITIYCAFWTWESINSEEKLKKEFKAAFVYRLADGMQDLFLNRPIGLQSVAILVIAFLAGVGIVGATWEPDLAVLYIILFFFIALPAGIIFLRRMGYLNRIMKQTKDMAEGRLTSEIKVKGKGKSPFARHAANLNQLREGVRKSMSEQAKSERLKTELITNVSHDLRTPLTSIITYTDLLKNPNLTEEERNKYIDVLDKKSARLKTLIEDLFEVSKMASGNIEINKQRIDLTQLMQQAVGEHEEAFANANLEIRVTMPEEPLYAYVDGQKWWRVLDNLVVNALKYSLEGTRVYVTLNRVGAEAQIAVKNISKYEMSENVEELTERFKRADASRHTDGSGLGLAIAQSIVDLHNGRLKIDVDGDLFKVTVTVPAEY